MVFTIIIDFLNLFIATYGVLAIVLNIVIKLDFFMRFTVIVDIVYMFIATRRAVALNTVPTLELFEMFAFLFCTLDLLIVTQRLVVQQRHELPGLDHNHAEGCIIWGKTGVVGL